MTKRPRPGDRYRVTRDTATHVFCRVYAPSHSVGVGATLPRNTVVFATSVSDSPRATGFSAIPEDWDELEPTLVPEEMRKHRTYAGGYRLSFSFVDIGDLLEPLAKPMDPDDGEAWRNPWRYRRDNRTMEEELTTSYYCWSRGDEAPLDPRPADATPLAGTGVRVISVERDGDRYLAGLSFGDAHLYEVWSISEPRGEKTVSAFEDAAAARQAFAADA